MPTIVSATDVVGVLTFILVLLHCVAGVLCLAYVLYFHYKVGKQQQVALRVFDSPWVVRIVLVGFAVLWSLAELLRLPLLRRKGWFLHRLDFAWHANLCRFHVVSSVGLLEPGFFLTALFLVHGSLHNGPNFPRSLHCRILSLVLVSCLPLFTLQLILAVISSSFQFHRAYDERKEGYGGTLPSYYTRYFEEEVDESNARLALCTYPLFSVLLLGLFALTFVVFFSYLGLKTLHLVINRKMRNRMCVLVVLMIVLLPLHALFLGLSVRLKAGKIAHEILTFVGFLTVLLSITVGEAILVVLPIADALAVRCVIENNRWLSLSTSPMETFGTSLSGFVSDDGLSQVERQSLLGRSMSSAGTDAESSRKEPSLTFDTMLKDITFGPGNRVAEIIGSMSSPGSSSLPGMPLISVSDSCNV